MEKWEYKVLDFTSHENLDIKKSEQVLNDYGEKGWEMTGVTRDGYKVYLKRRKES